MKIKTIGTILSICAIMIISGRALPQGKYHDVIRKMLREYPQSTVQDIYKSFFQDRFGPGHLVADTAAARKYLRTEIEKMGTSSLPYYEPAGAGKNFYRVNLSLVKEGVVSEDIFFSAFLESAAKIKFPTIEEWSAEWNEILRYIPTDIENYSADKCRIDSLLATGNYVCHHSRRYNEAYHPHYRLIDKQVFESRLLPLIDR